MLASTKRARAMWLPTFIAASEFLGLLLPVLLLVALGYSLLVFEDDDLRAFHERIHFDRQLRRDRGKLSFSLELLFFVFQGGAQCTRISMA